MKRSLVLGVIIGLIACAPAFAGDEGSMPPPWPPWFRGFPLDATARVHSNSVRESDACWRTCETHCSRNFQACARAFPTNDCRSESDHCDLACLKTCRTYGGPFLGITDSGP
ncbi:MAG TPA: hypothetical protein VK438_03360 [Xanthobacteraceae bacterium]|nr:hypothetical protein [Xanthobacteraceae bacterium]